MRTISVRPLITVTIEYVLHSDTSQLGSIPLLRGECCFRYTGCNVWAVRRVFCVPTSSHTYHIHKGGNALATDEPGENTYIFDAESPVELARLINDAGPTIKPHAPGCDASVKWQPHLVTVARTPDNTLIVAYRVGSSPFARRSHWRCEQTSCSEPLGS